MLQVEIIDSTSPAQATLKINKCLKDLSRLGHEVKKIEYLVSAAGNNAGVHSFNHIMITFEIKELGKGN